jgi:hypothetical protein
LLTPSIGLLDGQGRASMSYVFPPGVPQVASFTLHHAYMVLDPVTLELVDASNAWPLTFLN